MTDDDRGHPRWAESEPRLVELIRDEILAASDRHITFARFMERALTEPGLGYYATSRSRPTRSGDFLTAPELHPFFGRCIGRALERQWQALGRPARFVVREYGAGSGTLAAAIRAGLAADGSGLLEALDHEPVDLGLPELDAPLVGCILANEYLDALPVHRVVMRAGRLLERFVTWRDSWFADEDADPSTPDLAAHLAADGISLADGARAEICLAAPAWMRRVATQIERGHVLVIDYGHDAQELYGPRRMAGTLLGYRQHHVESDPVVAVGRMDLTAHVDVTAVSRAAADSGLTPLPPATLGPFLAAHGLGDLLSDLGRHPATAAQDYLMARASVARLLDPRHLGGFRVLRWSR